MPIERNLMIEAGAGTGKTTRLVKAVLQALFVRQIPLEKIVALTFTNKAAGELKERVASALEEVLKVKSLDPLKAKPWWPSAESSHSLTDLQKLASEATSVLDRANISTIHSFAFSLLKRFPLAAGIDPEAEIDDKGLQFDNHFRQEWPLWLMEELGTTPSREALWMELLSKVTLSEIEEAARRLADFEVPLEQLIIQEGTLEARLQVLHEEIRALCSTHTGSQKADGIARACEEIIGIATHGEWERLETLPQETLEWLDKKPGEATASWNEIDLGRLKLFLAIAKNVLKRGDHVLALLTEALAPFVRRFREVLLNEGCLTHSALLYLSREIVKNNPDIRTALKRSIQLILIDEFQDTDPLQAELLLYLTELESEHSSRWEDVKLESGKLFIVGDPKQSIYRFRGADIAAYERIGKLLTLQGGLRETLEVNYRSQSQIITLVNLAFERILLPEADISPPYIAVKPHHAHAPQHPVQNVEIWLADSPEAQSVEESQATEAEAVAQWIKESQGQLTIFDPREGGRRPMLYRDVALIFRTYSPMDRFIEAFRHHNIPFAVESERYFYTTPEVTEFINLLRAAEDPEDLLSLVGYLRSPMGGLTDQEILKRRQDGTLEEVDSVRWLRKVTNRLRRQPLTDVLQYIFDDSYLLELAARSYHGDQTVANLQKLRRLLEDFTAEGVTTMGLLLEKLEEFFKDDKIEGESSLADENYNAVRLLTVHKAKGLEYPVVFLPSLHSELKAHAADPFVYDWRTQTLGLSAGDYANLDKLLLDEQTRRREAAEENRILYVAMTRARERLVLSGGIHLKSQKKKNYLARLLAAWQLSVDTLPEGLLSLGPTSISIRRLEPKSSAESSVKEIIQDPLQRVDVAHFAEVWKNRAEKRQAFEETRRVITPTSLQRRTPWNSNQDENGIRPYATRELGSHSSAAHLGTLVHLFLEKWDFTCEKCSMPALLTRLANAYFAQEGLLARLLPDPKEGLLKLEKDDPMSEVVAIVAEAQRLLADFIDSDDYDEIKNGKILGREVPFFYSLKEASLMRGVMDILYENPDGSWVVGDYKTDRKPPTEETYAAQGNVYKEAVKRALGKDVLFKVIPLRQNSIA